MILVPLSGHIGGVTAIDDENAWVLDRKWRCNSHGYVVGKHNGEFTSLHRLILGLQRGDGDVDHIDGDKRNNQRSNLRLVSRQQSAWNRGVFSSNRSGHTGVFKKGRRWAARIVVSGKFIWLGSFATKEEAIRARVDGEAKYFGEFAPTVCRSKANE